MSDSEAQEPQGTAPDIEPQGSPDQHTPPQSDPPKQDTDWQAEARKWEQRAKKDAKSVESLREQVKQLVDPDEAQQQVKSVEDQLAAVTVERDTAQAEALRWQVALREGVPYEMASEFLHGGDEDTLVKRAAALKEWHGPSAPPVGTPHARVGAGENGDQPQLSWQQQVTEAERAGDWRKASRIKTEHLLASIDTTT